MGGGGTAICRQVAGYPPPKKLFLQPTPKIRSAARQPEQMPQKVEGHVDETNENLEVSKLPSKEAPEAMQMAEEEWWRQQHQQELAEVVAPVPDEEVTWDSTWESEDTLGHAAPVEPEGSQETEYTEGAAESEDMVDDNESIHPSELDELEKQISAETERVQALERTLMVPPEEDSDTEEEGQPPPKAQGRAGRKGAKSEDPDALKVIERLGISPEALLVAPATPPMKPPSKGGAAPRTPPLEEAKEVTPEDAKALEKLVRQMRQAPGTPPDPKSPSSHPPSSPVVIPTSAKTEPRERDVYQSSRAKSLEELVQQSFEPNNIPVKLQTDDEGGLGLRNALVHAVLNSFLD